MKANVPRSFDRLPPSEKCRIERWKQEEINRVVMVVLDIFLKMSCQALHDIHGLGEQRLMCYLGAFRGIFRHHVKLVKNGTQIETLDRRMRKIFRRDGYPDEYFRSMLADWTIETNHKGESQ